MKIWQTWTPSVVVLIAIAAVWAAGIYDSHRKSVIARDHGFEFFEDLEIVGTNKESYTVHVFWDSLNIIPGEHRILARVWITPEEIREVRFSSGNRSALKTVDVVNRNDRQELRFRFAREPGGWPISDGFAAIENGIVTAEWIHAVSPNNRAQTDLPPPRG